MRRGNGTMVWVMEQEGKQKEDVSIVEHEGDEHEEAVLHQ